VALVWPDRVVDENPLQAQSLALRAVFGVDWKPIRTVSGRGCQFTGEIRPIRGTSECVPLRTSRDEILGWLGEKGPSRHPKHLASSLVRYLCIDV